MGSAVRLCAALEDSAASADAGPREASAVAQHGAHGDANRAFGYC